jgi:anthranilate phosphoribosyltransferase
MVVHGADGLDELSTTGPNRITRLKNGRTETYTLDPRDLDLPRATLDDLKGGDARENATLVREVLDGVPGPRRDVVLLNAAACLDAAGVADDLQHGLVLAAASVDSGAARSKLEALVAFSQNGNS